MEKKSNTDFCSGFINKDEEQNKYINYSSKLTVSLVSLISVKLTRFCIGGSV